MLRPAPLALFLLLAGPAGAATVLSVGDGDTLRVVDDSKRLTIRRACIDAPETAQRPYGAASRQRLQELGPVGSVVTLRPQTIDNYGRTVAEVFRGGQNTNLAMVSSGQAFAYRKYLSASNQSAYLGGEAAAQRQRVGVWAVPGGIQRPEADMPADRQLCPCPGAAEARAQLLGQDRRWHRLRVAAVSLSDWEIHVGEPSPRLADATPADTEEWIKSSTADIRQISGNFPLHY
jgi:endonuclease YncB( thermonuclease family)